MSTNDGRAAIPAGMEGAVGGTSPVQPRDQHVGPVGQVDPSSSGGAAPAKPVRRYGGGRGNSLGSGN